MAFVIIPFGNIILPLILWLNKRDRVQEANSQGKNILNYQIVWTIISNVLFITGVFIKINHMPNSKYFILAFFFLCGINFIYAIYPAVSINKGKIRNYYPSVINIVR